MKEAMVRPIDDIRDKRAEQYPSVLQRAAFKAGWDARVAFEVEAIEYSKECDSEKSKSDAV